MLNWKLTGVSSQTFENIISAVGLGCILTKNEFVSKQPLESTTVRVILYVQESWYVWWTCKVSAGYVVRGEPSPQSKTLLIWLIGLLPVFIAA